MERSDEELLSMMAAGDSSAFGDIFDRYSTRVFGLLVKFVGRREDAEDLLQATFYEAWRRAPSFDPSRSRCDFWLLLIARSRALDHLRIRRPAVELAAVPEPATKQDLIARLERVEASDRLHQALERLPEEQRRAIELAFFAGLTHEQIAGKLETPVGTIKTRIRLGMNRLRDCLRDH
jgi:RNA polymerase sigma-70 factor, ECF subfamily